MLRQHVIEIARIRIDQDRAWRFLSVIVDDVAQELLGDLRLPVGRKGQKLAVARRNIPGGSLVADA